MSQTPSEWKNTAPLTSQNSVGVSFSVSDTKASNKAVFCARLIPTTIERDGVFSFEIRDRKDILWYHKVMEAINFLLIDDPSLEFTIDGHKCETFYLFSLVRTLRRLADEEGLDLPDPVNPYTIYLNETQEPLITISNYKP